MHVYISGPYTKPDPVQNTRRAIIVADRVRDAGAAPFLPHLFMAWHLVSPAAYEEWMDLCLAWVPKCDAMLRMFGESEGADREVELARSLGIPVFESLDALLKWMRGRQVIEVKKTLNLVYQGVPCPRCGCTMTIEIEGEL